MNGVVQHHPNATVALVSGSGLGTLIAWGATRLGVSLTVTEATVIAGAVSAVALFIGKNGIKGIIHLVWNGSGTKKP